MSTFETWQLGTAVAQTVILFGTLVAAIYIGSKQTQISKDLADLAFVVSVEVTYDAHRKRINIFNKGQTNIYLWGLKLGDGPKVVEQEPRLITPAGYYYILGETLESQIRLALAQNADVQRQLEIYVTNQIGIKYVVRTIVVGQSYGEEIALHTQTTSIRQEKWMPAA